MNDELLKRFIGCGQAAQKAVDKIVAEYENEKLLKQAANKATRTGNKKDLKKYLDLRRERL